MDAAAELNRMRWRCRRGMLELDILLGRFVETRYASLDADGRAALSRLLELPDTELLVCLSGQAEPTDAGVKSIVQQLRG